MKLNATRSNVPDIGWTTTRESQISLSFVPRSLVFQIIEVSCFFMGCNCEFESFEKILLKITHSKFQKSQYNFVRTIGRKIQDKFGNFWLRRVEEVTFWKSHFQKSHKHLCFSGESHWSLTALPHCIQAKWLSIVTTLLSPSPYHFPPPPHPPHTYTDDAPLQPRHGLPTWINSKPVLQVSPLSYFSQKLTPQKQYLSIDQIGSGLRWPNG